MDASHIAASLDTDSLTAGSAKHARLVHAAQQFEAVMLSELMKPLGTNGAVGEEEQGQANPMQSFGVESMAGSLARSGSLGFAQRIVASLEKRS